MVKLIPPPHKLVLVVADEKGLGVYDETD